MLEIEIRITIKDKSTPVFNKISKEISNLKLEDVNSDKFKDFIPHLVNTLYQEHLSKFNKGLLTGNINVSPIESGLALILMSEIGLDNGFFNHYYPEKYEAKWVDKIGTLAKTFFDNNSSLLTMGNITEICCWEQRSVEKAYDILIGFKELHESLNDYFENH